MFMKNYAKRMAVGLSLVLAASLPRPAAGEEGNGNGRPVPTVSAEIVALLEKSEPKAYVGTVSGTETVVIVSRVAGTLWKVAFKEGEIVKKGDLLYEIEDTVYKANVQIAEAVLKQAEAEHELAKKEHERSVRLLQTRAVAEQAFDTTLRTIALTEAKIEEAKANLILAKNDLAYTRIVSPIAGRIGETVHTEGNYITPSTGRLATVVAFDPIYVKLSMSESDFFRNFKHYGNGVNSAITIVRANGEPYKGKARVDFIDNLVDTRTGTITVRLKCENADTQLLPGGYVRVDLADRFEQPLPAVGVQAVMTDGVKHYVYVVDSSDTVERRDIVIGPQVYRMQTVKEGLKPGDRVIVGGLNKARPGMKVKAETAMKN